MPAMKTPENFDRAELAARQSERLGDLFLAVEASNSFWQSRLADSTYVSDPLERLQALPTRRRIRRTGRI
jgi:hypothetical protein